jgi:hypothetical protein
MPFALPEYDEPFARFAHEAVYALARARSPMLQLVPRETSPGTGGSVLQTQGKERVDIPMESLEYGISMDVAAVREGNTDALVAELDSAAEELAPQLVAMLIEAMERTTEHTGQVVRSSDPISFEAFYEALAGMEWSLKPNGELSLPSIVMHPETAEKFAKLPPATPEQEARLEALKKAKHEELLARRRNRRLA